MFTIADIRNIAVQIEKNGEETYRKASFASKNLEIAQLLAAMAEDEKRHGEWMASITSNKPLTEEQREMEAVGRALLQDMIKGNAFLLAANEHTARRTRPAAASPVRLYGGVGFVCRHRPPGSGAVRKG